MSEIDMEMSSIDMEGADFPVLYSTGHRIQFCKLSMDAILDLGGTFAFALSGSTLAAETKLDFVGMLTISFAAGLGGGVVRDLCIGVTPPSAIQDWRYLFVVICAGGSTLLWYRWIKSLSHTVMVFDAIGLGFFAVIGTQKAIEHGASVSGSIVLGVITGVGGGTIRDLLAGKIPAVFLGEIYALAALAASIVVTCGNCLGLPTLAVSICAMLVATGLRIASRLLSWKLPPTLRC